MIYKVDLTEAEQTLSHYTSVGELFTRKLKQGSREIFPPLCSPADGILIHSLPGGSNRAVQYKNRTYNLLELIGHSIQETDQKLWYFAVYLSPRSYHRVHSPIEGVLRQVTHIPGVLLAVNEFLGSKSSNIFPQSERVIFELENKAGGRVYVVMIGALNVGKIYVNHCPNLTSNTFKKLRKPITESKTFESPISIAIGEELGRFMLGSTVVVILDEKSKDLYQPQNLFKACDVKMGEKIVCRL